jgi:acetolactate synthase I/II/III large subunit
MHFHEGVARTLRANAVDVVFGVLGDGNLFIMDSFERVVDGRFVAVANEASGVQAANGYARTTGRVGVATVTYGPGLTNTITSLVEATRARTSIVLIAGDTAVGDLNNLQVIDQDAVVAPTGAGLEHVRSPSTMPEDIGRAFRRAQLERRPIVLNIPGEFQWQEIDLEPLTPRPPIRQQIAASEDALDVALGIIASSRRPLVVAGRGATSAATRDAVLKFARRVGAPVATTLQARELFVGEPENIGILGTLSTESALEIVGQADCIVAFGAALNRFTSGDGGLLSGAQVVHVDLDPFALNHHIAVAAPVNGDAAVVAEQLISGLDTIEFAATTFAGRVPAATEPVAPVARADGQLDIDDVLKMIDIEFPRERKLVFDGGRFFHHSAALLRTGSSPNSFVHTLEFGAIGLGMGNAIGAAIGSPDVPVLFVCGDGGFMLGGLVEFNTAVRYGADIVVVVLNDKSYGSEHVQFTMRGLDPKISTFEWPDLADVATALGGTGYAVRTIDDLTQALADIQQRDRPVLIDVHLDPYTITDPRS